MRLKFAIPLAFAAAYLPAERNAHAQTYAGGTTAGNLPATAEVVPGVAGVTYSAISGTTVPTATGDNTYNGEMYEITVATALASFTASTTAFVSGSNDFDDQISLFSASGVGIATNDDAASGGDQSSLTVASLAPANYYLLITGSGNYPVDSTGALIFPNFTQGVSSEGTYAATSSLPISAYTGSTNEGGSYIIALTTNAVVPEPSTLSALAAGLGGLTLVLRRRRS